jgi:hypothetical protein
LVTFALFVPAPKYSAARPRALAIAARKTCVSLPFLARNATARRRRRQATQGIKVFLLFFLKKKKESSFFEKKETKKLYAWGG